MKHFSLFSICVKGVDLLIVFVAGLLAFNFRFGGASYIPISYKSALLFGIGVFFICASFTRLYDQFIKHDLIRIFIKLTYTWMLFLLAMAVLAFILKMGSEYSRVWFLLWISCAYIVSLIVRILICLAKNIGGISQLYSSKILVVDLGRISENTSKKLSEISNFGYQVEATVKYNEKMPMGGFESLDIDSIDMIDFYIKDKKIQDVWVVGAPKNPNNYREVFELLQYTTTPIKLMPDFFDHHLLNQSITEFHGLQAISFRSSPMEGANLVFKLIEDKVLSIIILMLSSPVFLGIALAVKFSSKGPVFYRQDRLSYDGIKFKMLKFRSMPIGAESKSGAVWAKAGEERATKLGAFLRKTSLDELPQFINVLKGEMSIVGPRPERPVFVEKFKKEIPGYMQKHIVKAGITGWAQVNGFRGDTDLTKRIQYDLQYINHWSLWLDFKIIFMTFVKIFHDKHAY